MEYISIQLETPVPHKPNTTPTPQPHSIFTTTRFLLLSLWQYAGMLSRNVKTERMKLKLNCNTTHHNEISIVAYVCRNGCEVRTTVWPSYTTVSVTLDSTKPGNSILHTLLWGLTRSNCCENMKFSCAFFIFQRRPVYWCVVFTMYTRLTYLHHQMAELNFRARS